MSADQACTTLSSQCAELCGAGRPGMRAQVRAVAPEEFPSGAEDQRAAIQRADEDLAAQRGRREG
jgi:heme/copper-type cytochrome/quinol oxidase subunit 2